MGNLFSVPYSYGIAALAAGAVLYYLFGGGFGRTSRPHYAIEVSKATDDSSAIYQNYRIPKGEDLPTLAYGHPTVYAAIQAAFKQYKNLNALGTRPFIKNHTETKVVRGESRNWTFPELGGYKYLTYEQLAGKVNNIASAFVHLGLKEQENLAVYLETRAEWTMAAQACFCMNIVVMTCYANLGEEALVFGLNQAEARVMVTSGDLLASIAKYIGSLTYLKTIIYCDTDKADPAAIDRLKEAGITLYYYDDLEVMGKKSPAPHRPPKATDLAVLMYTSGSTGMPKGVMCTQANCCAAAAGVLRNITLRPGQVHLSYLPLAHILAFTVEVGCIASGVTVCYGSPRTVSDEIVRGCRGDIPEAAPHFLVGVPAVFDKIKAGILGKVSAASSIQQTLFHKAFADKKAASAVGKDTPIWNRLVFGKMKAALGGRVEWIVSGGAPLSKECGEFLRVCFGVPVLQGYALTETCAGGTLGELDDLSASLCVGPPIASVNIKLVDIPEMGYSHTDKEGPRGEIWIRGGCVSMGYYKNPEKTAEEFVETSSGRWFKTGDIGRINPNGTINIIDRKKNLVKPPHGEYIAVERLESSYKNSSLVANILVYACQDYNEVVALIFPNKVNLERWAASQGIDKQFHDLCDDPKANKAVLDSLMQTWKATNLKSMERISAVALIADEWTPQNSWLTAAMKLNRPWIVSNQKALIDQLYAPFK